MTCLRALPIVLVLALAAAAWAQTAAPAPGAAGRPAAGFEFLDYTAPVPASWEPQTPGSRYRAAQYRVPAAAGAGAAEAVVFYFGQGQGGSAAANSARWTSQFKGADGKAVAPKTETLTVNGLPATVIELTGSYARGIGGAEGVAARPDQTLLAAVIESPHGNLTVQLHGDRATVEQHRAGFMALVRGFARRP